MFAAIGNIFSVLKALLDLFKYFQRWQADQRKKEEIEKQAELDSAQEALANAKSEAEIFEAQARIARLKR